MNAEPRSSGDWRAALPTARGWWIVIAFLTLIALLNFGVRMADYLAAGKQVPWLRILVQELTAGWLILPLLVPVLIWIRRLPLQRSNWLRRLPLHLAASVVFGVLHTLGMWSSRLALYALFGWGRYEYGHMPYRFLMEYQKQVVTYALIYAVVAVLGNVRRRREEALRTAELEHRLTEARLEALRHQLNPHFLFNTLNTVSAFVHEDPGRAETMIARLGDLLRSSLETGSGQEVTLAHELGTLGIYLDIVRARFDSLEVEIDVPESVRGFLVPTLLLQPLVENAVAHNDQPGRLRVSVRARAERDTLRLEVADDGRGIGAGAAGMPAVGVGLSNTQERLRRLYGDRYRFELADRPGGGLAVRIALPLRQPAEAAAEAPPR
jgi:signal transduction histidine kinase